MELVHFLEPLSNDSITLIHCNAMETDASILVDTKRIWVGDILHEINVTLDLGHIVEQLNRKSLFYCSSS